MAEKPLERIVHLVQQDHVRRLGAAEKAYRSKHRNLAERYEFMERRLEETLAERATFERNVRQDLEDYYGDTLVALRAENGELRHQIPVPVETVAVACETEELESDHLARVESLIARHNVAKEEQSITEQRKLLDLAKQHEDERVKLREVFDAKLRSEVEVLEAKCEREIQAKADDLEKAEQKLTALSAELDSTKARLSEHDRRSKMANHEATGRYEQMKASYDELLATFKKSEESAIEMQKAHRKEIKHLQDEIMVARNGTENKWREVLEKESGRYQSVSAELQTVRADKNQLMAEHHVEVRKFESNVSQLEMELTALRAENRRLSERLDVRQKASSSIEERQEELLKTLADRTAEAEEAKKLNRKLEKQNEELRTSEKNLLYALESEKAARESMAKLEKSRPAADMRDAAVDCRLESSLSQSSSPPRSLLGGMPVNPMQRNMMIWKRQVEESQQRDAEGSVDPNRTPQGRTARASSPSSTEVRGLADFFARRHTVE